MLAAPVTPVYLGAALALALLPGCQKGPVVKSEPRIPEVFVDTPKVQEVTEYEDFSGRTEAIRFVEIKARVTGYLQTTFFKDGADVQQGAQLFQIDPRVYQAELDRAIAAVAQANAHFERLDTEHQRTLRLLKQKAVSQEESDRIQYERLEAQSAVAAARASEQLARLNLDFTKITAPFSGRISRRQVDPGNLIQADLTTLTNLVALDPLYVYFDVDERTVLRVRRLIAQGKVRSARETEVPVRIGLADEEEFSLSGTIDFVDNRVDPNTGTLRIRAVVPNPKRFLSPGLFVRIRLPIGSAHPATLVPEEALGSDQGQRFLYVVGADDKVESRRVQVGLLQGGMREIQNGLAPTERFVVRGLQRVRPGLEVKPLPLENDRAIPAKAVSPHVSAGPKT